MGTPVKSGTKTLTPSAESESYVNDVASYLTSVDVRPKDSTSQLSNNMYTKIDTSRKPPIDLDSLLANSTNSDSTRFSVGSNLSSEITNAFSEISDSYESTSDSANVIRSYFSDPVPTVADPRTTETGPSVQTKQKLRIRPPHPRYKWERKKYVHSYLISGLPLSVPLSRLRSTLEDRGYHSLGIRRIENGRTGHFIVSLKNDDSSICYTKKLLGYYVDIQETDYFELICSERSNTRGTSEVSISS